MNLTELTGYNKLFEEKFNIKRDYSNGISSVECEKKELKKCLKYLEDAAFFPTEIKLKIKEHKECIIMCRNNFSGRKYIDETKSNMYDEDYPQEWNDNRLFKEICEIIG